MCIFLTAYGKLFYAYTKSTDCFSRRYIITRLAFSLLWEGPEDFIFVLDPVAFLLAIQISVAKSPNCGCMTFSCCFDFNASGFVCQVRLLAVMVARHKGNK